MQTGTRLTPAAGRDRVLTAAVMAERTGFVVALVLGLGRLLGFWSFATWGGLHILAGILVLAAILVAGVRALMLGKGAVLLLIGLLGGAAGAAVALAGLGGLAHMGLMIVAVGLAEANVAKLKKA